MTTSTPFMIVALFQPEEAICNAKANIGTRPTDHKNPGRSRSSPGETQTGRTFAAIEDP
jgi:hypothetical protein